MLQIAICSQTIRSRPDERRNEQVEFTIQSAAMIHASSDLGSIRELNLSYLMLAQRMWLEDRSVAMFRLGLSPEVATILSNLTLAQVIKLSGRTNSCAR